MTAPDEMPAGLPAPGVPDISAGAAAPAPRRARRKAAPAARRLAAGLAGVAAATGAAIPEADRTAPRLSVNLPISAFARELGRLLSARLLFIFTPTRELVTVDEHTGERRPMTPLRFVSWAESFVTFTRDTAAGPVVVSISEAQAARVMAADEFTAALRLLDAVHRVRLPQWANPERTAVRLLPPGYDAASRSFTVDAVPYPDDLLIDVAVAWLRDWLADFPFSRPDADPAQPLERNRSFAVMLSAMLAVYASPLLRGYLRPAIAIRANQPGSGKSLLARIIPAAVHGAVSLAAMPKDEAERGKVLTTLCADGKEFAIFDNIRGYLASEDLEAFLTAPRRSGRILGKTESIESENRVFLILTGNGLDLSPDLARRCLTIDLWAAEAVAERAIRAPIREDALGSDALRGQILACLWSITEWWSRDGCPRFTDSRLPSFEAFGEIVAGMVRLCGLADPLAAPEMRLDEAEASWLKLFRHLADDLTDGGAAEFTLDEIIEAAEELGILVALIGDPKSPKVSMGKRLSKWRGREFRDSTGRRFRFAHRYAEAGARYPVTNLEPAPVAS